MPQCLASFSVYLEVINRSIEWRPSASKTTPLQNEHDFFPRSFDFVPEQQPGHEEPVGRDLPAKPEQEADHLQPRWLQNECESIELVALRTRDPVVP